MIIKLLQWNFWYKERPDNIVKEIKIIKPDLICGQELFQNTEEDIDTAQYIAKEIQYNFFYKEAETWSPVKRGKTSQGNAIFSKYPIIKKSFTYLTKPCHNPPDARFEGRVYLEVSLDIKGKELTVGTTHLSFSPQFAINEKRILEVNRLLPLFKSRKQYIFGGDLNRDASSYTVQLIKQYLKHAGPDYNQPTWPTKPFDYHGQFKETKLKWRIDFVFTSSDIKVRSSKIIHTSFSDHLPILVELEI